MRVDEYICDRCKKKITSGHKVIRFQHPDSNVSINSDLCGDCVEEFIKFMEVYESDGTDDSGRSD